MALDNPLRGEQRIEVGGRELVLYYDIDVLCRLETHLDLGIEEIAGQLNAGARLSLLRAIFWAGLWTRQPDLTEVEAGELFRELAPGAIKTLVVAGLNNVFPTAAEAADTGGPRAAPEANGAGTGPASSATGASSRSARRNRSGNRPPG
jgi:hypothetical protein